MIFCTIQVWKMLCVMMQYRWQMCPVVPYELMNNNKAESYHKLRSLYQKKFMSLEGDRSANSNPCRIKFKNMAQAFLTASKVDISINSIQDSTAIDQATRNLPVSKRSTDQGRSARLSINIKYAQINPNPQHIARNSQSQNRAAFSSEGKRQGSKRKNIKTLIFPNTSRDPLPSPLPTQSNTNSKYSLIQMIDSIKKINRKHQSKIIFETIDVGAYRKYENRNEQGFRKNTGRFKVMPHSFKVFNKTCHSDSKASKIPKEDLIDPWIVSENDEDYRKYY